MTYKVYYKVTFGPYCRKLFKKYICYIHNWSHNLLKVNKFSLTVASNPLLKTKEWIQRSTIKPTEGCYKFYV